MGAFRNGTLRIVRRLPPQAKFELDMPAIFL
jgi:hypothetical protein